MPIFRAVHGSRLGSGTLAECSNTVGWREITAVGRSVVRCRTGSSRRLALMGEASWVWVSRRRAMPVPTGRNAHARVLLRTPSGMKMLDGAGTPHGLMARGLGAPASSPGGGLQTGIAALRAATARCHLGTDGAGGWCCAIRACSSVSFARQRRAVPVRDRRSKPSPSSGGAAFTQQLAGAPSGPRAGAAFTQQLAGSRRSEAVALLGGRQVDMSWSIAMISFSTCWMSASMSSSGRGGRYS